MKSESTKNQKERIGNDLLSSATRRSKIGKIREAKSETPTKLGPCAVAKCAPPISWVYLSNLTLVKSAPAVHLGARRTKAQEKCFFNST